MRIGQSVGQVRVGIAVLLPLIVPLMVGIRSVRGGTRSPERSEGHQ
jgi:hypothetical protein